MRMICAAILLPVLAIFGGNSNLLINGDFESGKQPWAVSEWSTPHGKVSYAISQAHKHEGNNSAEIRHLSGGSNIVLGQKVSIAGRNNLMLSFYALGDVQPGKSMNISASFITVDSAGKKLQYVNKPFQATENWEKFTWQFSTHPNTAAITIYLRSSGGCVWFDDAELNIFSGPSITELQLWYPSREIIPTLMTTVPGISEITSTIRNASGEKVFSKKLTLQNGKNTPVLKAKAITPGKWMLEIVDSNGNAIRQSFIWPEEAPATPNRKNNFVTVLLQKRETTLTPGMPLVFDNPRKGWICLTLCSKDDATLSFKDMPGKEISLKAGERKEVMQFAPKGICKLTTPKSVLLTECDIRTVAEMVFCEYEGMKSRKMFFSLMNSPAGQAMLDNSNVIIRLDPINLPKEVYRCQ